MATPKNGYWLDNQRLPSVTTILSRFKDSGALTLWAYKTGREHENLRARGLPAPDRLYDTVEKAANAGTIAHDLIETDILGQPYTPPADTDPAVLEKAMAAYESYLTWRRGTRLEITHTELSLMSPAHRFGGTLDAVGKDADGRIVLVDWKTSNAIYADYLLQLAAYTLLLREVMGMHVEGFHLLRVSKEAGSFSHHYWKALPQCEEQFLAFVACYKRDQAIKALLK